MTMFVSLVISVNKIVVYKKINPFNSSCIIKELTIHKNSTNMKMYEFITPLWKYFLKNEYYRGKLCVDVDKFMRNKSKFIKSFITFQYNKQKIIFS